MRWFVLEGLESKIAYSRGLDMGGERSGISISGESANFIIMRIEGWVNSKVV
jgi:hypothetical protein